MKIYAIVHHSMEKILPGRLSQERVEGLSRLTSFSLLSNERYSYQIFARAAAPGAGNILKTFVTVDSPIAACVRVRRVGYVPSEFPAYPVTDDNYVSKEPGLFPDPLYDLEDGNLALSPMVYRALFVTVEPNGTVEPGTYPITVRLTCGEDTTCVTVEATVLAAQLPPQKLIHTEWFHADCLASYYGLPMLSEAHWARIEEHIAAAARMGINMLLTPVFTPPLDTAIGGERPTIQLVGVRVDQGKMTLDFTQLGRWIELCKKHGILYLEIAHFFTQWGAKCAPKVMATVDGEYKRLFGWETPAQDPAFVAFLRQLITELYPFCADRGYDKDHLFFHISDEPRDYQLEAYQAARNSVADLIAGSPNVDALSDFSFYQTGAVPTPIPASNHIGPFLEADLPQRWVYYCCSQHTHVSNRFIAMPGARTRIFGLQLYKFRIDGFLQWGFNFYYSQHSVYPIDPFTCTDSLGGFPSGDAFMVYPGPNGVIESMRYEYLHDALQDLRALQLLEQKIGRDAVLVLLEEFAPGMTFESYPHSADALLAFREKVNALIAG